MGEAQREEDPPDRRDGAEVLRMGEDRVGEAVAARDAVAEADAARTLSVWPATISRPPSTIASSLELNASGPPREYHRHHPAKTATCKALKA